jgi:hypothetical protein
MSADVVEVGRRWVEGGCSEEHRGTGNMAGRSLTSEIAEISGSARSESKYYRHFGQERGLQVVKSVVVYTRKRIYKQTLLSHRSRTPRPKRHHQPELHRYGDPEL